MASQGMDSDPMSLSPSRTSIPSGSRADATSPPPGGREEASSGQGKNINGGGGIARSASFPSQNFQNPRARPPKSMGNLRRNPSYSRNNPDINTRAGVSNKDSESTGLPRTSSLPVIYRRAVPPPPASAESKSLKSTPRQISSVSQDNLSANAGGNVRPSLLRGNSFRRQNSRHNNLGNPPTSSWDGEGVSATGRQQQQQHHFKRSAKQLDDGGRSGGAGMFLDERDEKAKAKRLCRFNTESNRPPGLPQADLSLLSGSRNSQPQRRSKALQDAAAESSTPKRGETEENMDYEDFDALPDRGDCAVAEPILGSCQEMCPESEREERERTGDIDKFERLEGNGNQPDCYLLVKKYNRAAERDVWLIRPLPVLQQTMDHLMNLLNCAYNDDFLSMYNFLWDRMRAIRMDLRMQHIFNQDTILMLEQMIRFHIVAMHELCESAKGEGFSEGFDAHLNIEHMNKTSAELFQMYDDHRKRGILVPSEAEFRGYYTLLKLDKHPGHKVEPAELSLDLSKMTPDIRNTSEVIFARQVAKSSRLTNFVTFFRYARKATYLQCCLMHAHFAKY